MKTIQHYYFSWLLKQAIKKGNQEKAIALLEKIKALGVKLSWWESLYQEQLKHQQHLHYYKKEVFNLSRKLEVFQSQGYILKPEFDVINHVTQCFKLQQLDWAKVQVTGIEEEVFSGLEKALAEFIIEELNKIEQSNLKSKLKEAIADLEGLKKGIDPSYNYFLSPHVYLLKYFTENIYCSYLTWFLVYQNNYLPRNLKILDIAAGPGTVIYGLALLFKTMINFISLPNLHISYYSLEQQANLQYRGLQFWRKYIETQSNPLNSYFRFNSLNIFDYHQYSDKLPDNFFDFIVISHCFFYNQEQRKVSHQIYQEIFHRNLNSNGYVLLIIQGKKLFSIYELFHSEDKIDESRAISMFLDELGLTLVWYRYLTSTGKRLPLQKGFSKFARENLPSQTYLASLRQEYLGETYTSNYTIDDYVILAKKS